MNQMTKKIIGNVGTGNIMAEMISNKAIIVRKLIEGYLKSGIERSIVVDLAKWEYETALSINKNHNGLLKFDYKNNKFCFDL